MEGFRNKEGDTRRPDTRKQKESNKKIDPFMRNRFWSKTNTCAPGAGPSGPEKPLQRQREKAFGLGSTRRSAYWQSIPDEPRVVWAKVVVC
jgi:hypothetical protein